jgi:Grx4 family monothiol glutaredoxin
MACKGNHGPHERVFEVKKEGNLNRICNTQYARPILLFFFSQQNKDAIELLDILKGYFEEEKPDCSLAMVDCDTEDTSSLVKNFEVSAIPTAVLISPVKKVLHRFEDLDPVTIVDAVDHEAAKFQVAYQAEGKIAFERIKELLDAHKVIVFMKGTAEAPECGFSEQIMEALRSQGVRFEAFNLLSPKDNLRNWIKVYSNWPSIPQLFINGQIIGGVDKTRDLISKDQLLPLIPDDHKTAPVYTELNKTISSDKLVLFVTSNFEGEEEIAKRCDNTMRYLQLKGLLFRLIDLKTNQALRKALESTHPQGLDLPILYHNGQELHSGDELFKKASSADDFKSEIDVSCFRGDTNALLTQLVNMRPLMIFIKGTPSNPQCGFTRTLLGELEKLNLEFGFFNILQDEFIRENLKHFSNWKTYPQVYIKGELVGGLDILKELIEEGEFQKMTAEFIRK